MQYPHSTHKPHYAWVPIMWSPNANQKLTLSGYQLWNTPIQTKNCIVCGYQPCNTLMQTKNHTLYGYWLCNTPIHPLCTLCMEPTMQYLHLNPKLWLHVQIDNAIPIVGTFFCGIWHCNIHRHIENKNMQWPTMQYTHMKHNSNVDLMAM
jgi:hypothetical protein